MPYKSPKRSRTSSRSKPGPKPTSKSKVRLHVEKGSLPGYFLADKQMNRRKILKKLAKRDTWVTIVKRLNILYIYNKNRHPDIAAKFRRDMKYIQKEFSPDYSTKKSKRRSVKKRKSTTKRRSVKKRKSTTKRRSVKKRKSTTKRRSVKM
jgi:hypothetical protein